VTIEAAPRPFWFVALGGLAGAFAGIAWTWLVGAVLNAIDDEFRWPLPTPLAVLATVLVAAATWLPWVPLFLRVGFRWWFVFAAVFPLAAIALTGVTGVRLAATLGRSRSATTSPTEAATTRG
jgi:hypothetical protein